MFVQVNEVSALQNVRKGMFYWNMIAAVGGKSEFCSVKCVHNVLRHAPPSPSPIRYPTPRKCKQIVLGHFEAIVVES